MFKDLIAVRVKYISEYVDDTIALVTSELKAREAVRNWYIKYTEDEGGLTDYAVERSANYTVHFDKVEADGTVTKNRLRTREFTVADVI